jgi:phi13 family phage major tail protein
MSQAVVSGIVGVEKLCFAPLKEDMPGGTPIFDTPIYLQGVKQIGLKIKINTEKLYAENKLWESDTTFDSTETTVDVVDLLAKEESIILGHELSEEGGVIYKDTDKATPGALLFKSNKGNGKARYVIFYNNTFTDSDESQKGKEGKTDYQTKTITSTGAPLKSNGMWKYKIDEEDGMTDEIFFNSVIIPKVMQYLTVVYTGYTSGTVNNISITGITFDTVTKSFKDVPSNITSFTFKLDGTAKTATKTGTTWDFA